MLRIGAPCKPLGEVTLKSREGGLKELRASRSRSTEGKETWSMRFFAAAMARRAKDAIRRASAVWTQLMAREK